MVDFQNFLWEILPDSSNKRQTELCIYGLGTTGRLVIDLCAAGGIEIAAVYTGKNYFTNKRYAGIEVLNIADIENKDMILLYSVKQEVSREIQKALTGKEKILFVDISSVQIYQRMLELYYENYFAAKGIQASASEKIMNFAGCRMINPSYAGVISWPQFLMETGDIILPGLFDDYSRIDEGSYEYHNVRIEEGDVVIDAGANIGCFSAFAAYRGGEFMHLSLCRETIANCCCSVNYIQAV